MLRLRLVFIIFISISQMEKLRPCEMAWYAKATLLIINKSETRIQVLSRTAYSSLSYPCISMEPNQSFMKNSAPSQVP